METVKRIFKGILTRATPLTISAAFAIIAIPAYAQFESTTAKLTNFQQALIGVGVTIITCALLWICYRMVFQHAKWAEMTQVFWGGVLGGSAPVLAAWLFS
jgi:type IV secretion system protein VirB2